MKVALILARRDQDLDQYPPLGLGYLAAVLKRRDPSVELTYCNTERAAARLRPDLALVSASSANYGIAIRIAGELKRRSRAPVLVGGVHVSTLPESLHAVFDAGVVGEGEVTLAEWLDAWAREGRVDAGWMRAIPGLVVHGADGPVRTPERDLIADLDSVPHPDRALLGYRGEPAHLMTSRGCPYSCAFCSSSAHWRRYRTFSVDYVIEEIDDLVENHGAKQVHVYDDLFVASAERLRRFAALYRMRGYPERLTASCAVRANLVDAEAVGLLASMGFSRVTFGAESASDAVLCSLKAAVHPEDNALAVRLCHDAGLRVGLSFIVGSPEEKTPDLIKTYMFIMNEIHDGRIDQADVNVLTPFPSTPIWEEAKARGLVADDMDWDRLHAPWRGLVMGESLRQDGLRAVLYDLRVRKMLDRWRTPVTALIPADAVAPDDLGALRALTGSENAISSLVLLGDGPDELVAGGGRAWWPILRRGAAAILDHADHEDETPAIGPIWLLISGPRLLLDRPEIVRYLTWVHFEDGNDLTTIDGFPEILACSGPVLKTLLAGGRPAGPPAPEDFPGYRVARVARDPARYSFDRDLYPDPLPGDLVFREIVDLYARLSTERLRYANAESGLQRLLADREREIKALADRAPGAPPKPAPSPGKDRAPWIIFRKNR